MKFLTVILSFCCLTSCVGGGGTLDVNSAGPVLTSFVSVMAQLPRGNTAATLPSNVNLVTTGPLATFAAPTCYSSTPTVRTDADSDGIALLKEYTFDCEDFVDNTTEYNHQGSFKVIDKNDAVAGPKGGYRFEFDMPVWFFRDLTTDLTIGGSHAGFYEGSGTDTTSRYLSDYEGRTYGEFSYPSLGKVSVDYTFKHVFDVNYTHDSVASGSPWSTGAMNGTGTFEWNGTFLHETAGGEHSVKNGSAKMTWESKAITFDVACTKWYKSGEIIIIDSGGNELKTVFKCTTVEVYFNNKLMTGTYW